MIIISAPLCSFFAWFSGYSKSAKAVTVFPFIFVRSKDYVTQWLLNHERIHIRQQIELLLIGSMILYIIEFLYAFLWLRYSWQESYLYTSAEQEAYRNQNDSEYLKQRNLWAQFKYLFNKKRFIQKKGVITYL